MPTLFVPGRDAIRSEEKKRVTRKHPKVIPSAIFQLSNPGSMTIIPVAHISASVFVGISVVDLPLMASHQRVLPLPVSVVADGDHLLYTSITSYSLIPIM